MNGELVIICLNSVNIYISRENSALKYRQSEYIVNKKTESTWNLKTVASQIHERRRWDKNSRTLKQTSNQDVLVHQKTGWMGVFIDKGHILGCKGNNAFV